MNSFLKILLAAVFLSAAAGGGYYYYTQAYLPAQAAPAPALQTAKVRSGDIVISIAGAGNLLPAVQVSVGFRSSGVVAEVNAVEGNPVEAGELLARLDDTALRLQLQQYQLNLQALISPEAVIEAEVAALNAETALEKAIQELEYLISPAVWRWENELARAQAELQKLQSDSSASADALAAAQKAVASAQGNLAFAQQLYDSEYVPLTFNYTYTDLETEEELEALFPPSEADITLARAKVKSAELALQVAQAYAAELKLGQPCDHSDEITAAQGTLLSKLEQACLDIEETSLALGNTHLLAPIAGTVTSLELSAGQAAGTSPVVTIATLDQLLLRIYIEETDLAMLKVDQRVQATFDAYPDQIVYGQISRIEPALQTVDGTPVVVAWASLENKDGLTLLSGMAAEVEIIAGESKGTLLAPVQALRELAPGSYAVFIVQADGELKLTPVTVGLKDFANAELLSGVQAGDVLSTGTVETK
jgi:multidrug efflux pump subunit AcrA (membrane-fusion protein)